MGGNHGRKLVVPEKLIESCLASPFAFLSADVWLSAVGASLAVHPALSANGALIGGATAISKLESAANDPEVSSDYLDTSDYLIEVSSATLGGSIWYVS